MKEMYRQTAAEKKVAELHAALGRRAGASAFGSCPLEFTAAFLRLCLAESCGKCVPCRVGLDRLVRLLERLLEGAGSSADVALIEETAQAIYDAADCAIGFEAAKAVLDGLSAFRADYLAHAENGVCTASFAGVPCQEGCPAHVNIPGYVACIGAGRLADAVRVIRRDNPFPGVCGLICEHPCERACRRAVVDDAINIRALKRFAVEQAGEVPPPPCAAPNGKTVAVVGAGPAGLTAAYYLALAGFAVTVYERRPKLGGMLRYGIPAYRLADADLDRDIRVILSTGVTVACGVAVGTDVGFDELRRRFDAVYLAIGAHGAKRLGIPGEEAKGVLSAVELLGATGAGERPDFRGKRVVVVGGGNVAMDATRTARRLGAARVTCVYRRRIADMTALPEEIAGAQAEGCEIVPLMAPVRVAVADGAAVGLVVRPQLAGSVRNGRPAPVDADRPEATIPCDFVIVAIGQDIESAPFAAEGLEVSRGAFVAAATGAAAAAGERLAPVFVGGDCYTGPATVIRAIDAGKVAAKNLAETLVGSGAWGGADGVEIPPASACSRLHWGRVNLAERPAAERQGDFEPMELGMTAEEAKLECSRCLRCDRSGFGAFRCREGG